MPPAITASKSQLTVPPSLSSPLLATRAKVSAIAARKAQVARHLDSCVLAMQNLRLDLLKLKSSNVAEVMGDITHATQAARAISRNVDNAIDAAGEIEEAMGR